MEPESGGGRDADLAARNMAEQDCACRLAGSDNADVDTARCETSPACIVLEHAAAVIVVHVDGFRHRGSCKTAHQRGEEKSEDGRLENGRLEIGHGALRPLVFQLI